MTQTTEQRKIMEHIVREIHNDGFSAGMHGQCAFRIGHFDVFVNKIMEAMSKEKINTLKIAAEDAVIQISRLLEFLDRNNHKDAIPWLGITEARNDLLEALRAFADGNLKVEATKPAERTPKDYAIEFGEYLAKAAEGYIKAINTGNPFRVDHLQGLKSAIYEFRKRAERAIQSDAASAPSVQDGWQPIEPTTEMIVQGALSSENGLSRSETIALRYKSMIAAAPKQPDHIGEANKMGSQDMHELVAVLTQPNITHETKLSLLQSFVVVVRGMALEDAALDCEKQMHPNNCDVMNSTFITAAFSIRALKGNQS